MTPADLGLAFGLGLAGSLHCAQMCGPIVLAFSGAGGRGVVLPHVCYHLGRLITYSFLGAIAGGIGGLGRLAGIERGFVVATGLLMILAGLLMTGKFKRGELVRIGSNHPLSAISRRAGRFLLSPEPSRKLLLGLGLGFLPCGLIYAALVQAMGTGDARYGALAMLAFGAGTAASLLAIGVFSSAIRVRLGGALPRWIPALCVAAFGMILVWRGAQSHVHSQGAGGEACHVHGRR